MKKTQLFSFLVLAFSMQSNCMNNRSIGFNVSNKVSRKSNSSSNVKSSILLFLVAFQLENNSLDESKASNKQQYRGGGSSVSFSRNRKQQQRYNKKQNRGGGRYGGSRGLNGSGKRSLRTGKYGRGKR